MLSQKRTHIFSWFVIFLTVFITSCRVDEPTPDIDTIDKQFNPDYVFDINSLPTITLTITENEWNKFLSKIDDDINTRSYIHADLLFEKEEQKFERKDVGFRLRGNHSRIRPEGTFGERHNSLNPQWHPSNFGICFTKYDKDNPFFGCDRIILKSFRYDYMYCREVFCYDLFRRFGVWSAPRASYCRLFIKVKGDSKPAYFGLYTMIEGIRDEYLQDRFQCGYLPTPNGNLWKITPTTQSANIANAQYPEFIGLDDEESTYIYTLKNNKESFENAKNELMDFASTLYSMNTRSDELKTWLNQHIDIDLFLRYLAVDVIVGSWDDYWFNGNNYYFYLDGNQKFYMIPYDYDNTLGRSSIIDSGTRDVMNWGRGYPMLVLRIFLFPEYVELYKKYLHELANSNYLFAFEGSQNRIRKFHNLISGYIENDIVDGEGLSDEIKDETIYSEPGYYKLLSGDSVTNFFLAKIKSVNGQ